MLSAHGVRAWEDAECYLYGGLRIGASAEDVLARADGHNAPFASIEGCRAWVRQCLSELA